MKLHAYCGNSPTSRIDPMGLGPQPGQDWGKNVVEFLAGVGYGMSFGTIRSAWHAEDVEDVIDYNSPWFHSGAALGLTHTVLTAAVTGGAALSFLRARLVALVGAGATAAAGGSQVAQNPTFELAERVSGQLQDPRLGSLAGKLTPERLNQLINNPTAQRFLDAKSGHINVIQDVDGVLLRITTVRDAFRIISVGPIKPNGLTNGIASGRFIPLP